MRTAILVLGVMALLAPSVAADTLGAGGIEQEFSSRDVTCRAAATCDAAPSVDGRAEVEEGEVEADTPDHRCVDTLAKDGETSDPDCAPREPSVEPGVVRLWADVEVPTQAGAPAESYEDQAATDEAAPAAAMTPAMQAALVAGSVAAVSTGAIAVFGLRRLLLLMLAPLATRLEPGRLLDDETRMRIYSEIKASPGVNLRTLAGTLDLAWGTLLHHLHKLEKAHMVVSRRYGKYRRYFVNGCTYSQDEQAKLAALSTPSTARVAQYVLEHPGSTQTEIGDAIGVTASTVLWHARRLKQVGLVSEARDGRFVRYYAVRSQPAAPQIAAA